MMAEPQAALARSQEALAIARREPGDAALHVATAQWLQGDALMRLNRLPEAEQRVEQGLASVTARARLHSKLHGDLVMTQAKVRATEGAAAQALQGFQDAYRIFAHLREPAQPGRGL